MRELYIELMERALGAYSREHIERYFAEVKQNGLPSTDFRGLRRISVSFFHTENAPS
jgi:hypothetical protein